MAKIVIPTDPEFSDVVYECDTCDKGYTYEPEGSFQTYNAEWFCSEKCGEKGGW